MKCPKCGYLGSNAAIGAGTAATISRWRHRPVRRRWIWCSIARSNTRDPPLISIASLARPTPAPALAISRCFPLRARGQRPGGSGARRVTPCRRLPLITARPPRAPLGVRRATPEVPRARLPQSRPESGAARITLFLTEFACGGERIGCRPEPASSAMEQPLAAPSSRILAALVDGALSARRSTASWLYFTLRLCGLTAAEAGQLPLLPLAAFSLLLNGGYFVAFTAVGGQSIGKMALGIKVVTREDESVPIGRAALRTLAYLVSALPLGAGFLPGVISADRLALHDRLAHTRVVRPS